MTYFMDWKQGFASLSLAYMEENDYNTHLIRTFSNKTYLIPLDQMYKSDTKEL